ncbi:tandem-95 repeat protein [Sphingomonas ginkgonis]|uniref:Tandem-95 repeat protein n=1 Tax=Sphingomonas ginkgonis TaxID=2315330 RepID=A0A429VBR3_9SPHN|nr:Ig-like domain-containing protein [Sphingomonas ginkgonis]RST31439.1 tandem-95 repeat protein [Sphingomonas ginkgonis]
MPIKARRDANALLENGSVSGNALLNDSQLTQVNTIQFGTGASMPVSGTGTTIQGTYGALTIFADGSYSYTASSDRAERLAAGTIVNDYFNYTASGSGGSAGSDLKFTVTGVNDAPVLTSLAATLKTINEDATGNAGQAVSSFLGSTDVDSGALRGIAVTGLASGNGEWQYSLNGGTSWSTIGSVSGSGALLLRSTDFVRFVPNAISGTNASFTFRAWDQSSGTAGTKVSLPATGGQTAYSDAQGSASITVTSVNDAPVGVAGTASGTQNGPPVTGQVHATDVDSPTLTYALVANSAVGGSVTIDPTSGNYSFTPAQNFSGAASFSFTASDGALTSAPAPVSIAIAGVNAPPTANPDSASTAADTPVLIDVLANDSDPNNDTLTIAAVGSAGHGTVQIQNGKVLYTPAAGYSGGDAFTYTAADGAGGTANGNVSVTVAPASTGPSAVTVTFRQGSNGYTGTVDTTLRESRATTYYGDAIMSHSALETGKEFQPLLRFDNLFGTAVGQIPLGATIVSATLRLEVTEASATGGSIDRMLAPWSAASTWSSLGGGVQLDGVEATTAGGVTTGAVALGSRVFDVTSSLQAWNAAASTASGQNAANLGWLFKAAGIDGWDFTSAQGATKPFLSVTYTQAGTVPASLPAVSLSAATAVENAGSIVFNVSLSQSSSQAVDVTLGTAGHTALPGTDFTSKLQTLTFAPGETLKTFTLSLVNDGTAERPETMVAQILSATNARVDVGVGLGRIRDDDVSVATFTPIAASVAAVHNLADGTVYQDGSGGTYGISDPSAIAYVPSLGGLLIGDSEHDESPFFSPTNLFSVKTDGTYVGNFSLASYTKEPTGLAYNAANDFLYIADDDKAGVFWTAVSNPSVKLGFFDTGRLGFLDTEDLKFDPLTGHIYILDGLMKQIIELTDQGQFVDSIKLPSVMTDAEALAYDSKHDVFFVGSGVSANIWVLNHDGDILQTLTTLTAYSPRPKLKGFELAPSSDPNDGTALSLYVADYGNDQVNDGRLFEIHLGGDWFT